MAEEKQTPAEAPIDDTLGADDTDVLREVLLDSRVQGISPVSLYTQTDTMAESD